MQKEAAVFPFTAVVNQEQVKRALLLNAVTHDAGGVLIRGRRGTAKSTLVRGLAHLLPELDYVTDCPFYCNPQDIESLCGHCAEKLATEGSLLTSRTRMKVVTLPLNATEEMVVGTLDIEKALRCGEKCFEPGILARANRSILYVDEVNLLEDHIVDILLDAAAMGINVVEREGISFKHASRFILVGTMNPQEGDLRPQLEDRFGLCAEVDEEIVPEKRAEILRRNLQFSRNPLEFESRWHAEQESLRRLILSARELYQSVEIPEVILEIVSVIVHRAGADGHRADISMLHSARALAALEGLPVIDKEHVTKVANLALNHRLRKGPLGIESGEKLDIPALIRDLEPANTAAAVVSDTDADEADTGARACDSDPQEQQTDEVPEPSPEDVSVPDEELSATSSGRRGHRRNRDSRGRYYRSSSPLDGKPPSTASEIAIDATIRATAVRGGDGDGRLKIQPSDLKVKLRKRKCGASIMFVVDASASMGARRRLEVSRQAIISLLVEAYQKRDRVGLVVFKDDSAQLVMTPTSSPALANRLMADLAPGGTTPLSHGLILGSQMLDRELSRNPQPIPVLVLISDGGGNVTMGDGDPLSEALDIAKDIRTRGVQSVVIDSAPTRNDGKGILGRPTTARRIAEAMGGAYFHMRKLTRDAIVEKVTQSARQIPQDQKTKRYA